jgi:hypothetical protein
MAFGGRPCFRVLAQCRIIDQGVQEDFDFLHTAFGVRIGRAESAGGLNELVEHR